VLDVSNIKRTFLLIRPGQRSEEKGDGGREGEARGLREVMNDALARQRRRTSRGQRMRDTPNPLSRHTHGKSKQ
jgi:hypothetical protein